MGSQQGVVFVLFAFIIGLVVSIFYYITERDRMRMERDDALRSLKSARERNDVLAYTIRCQVKQIEDLKAPPIQLGRTQEDSYGGTA